MSKKTRTCVKKSDYILRVIKSRNNKVILKQISDILERDEEYYTDEEKVFLVKNKTLVSQIRSRNKQKILKQLRSQEVTDEPRVLAEKCKHLAKIIEESRHVVVYTGAGISTSASIPDYRGSQGIWTKLQQGETFRIPNIVDCQPTYTHMTLELLHRMGKVQHIVSQNCDGLHLRSGLKRASLSELHGNMFIEKCLPCGLEFVRLFDVTKKTSYRHHATSRSCDTCQCQLTDTIVHFGETSKLHSPYKWQEAIEQVNKADLIICIGSSLKILKSYSCLWSLDKKIAERPKICIINLQWTCKDSHALLKINAKCDEVLGRVMECLKIEVKDYKRSNDPLFSLAIPVLKEEIEDEKCLSPEIQEQLQPLQGQEPMKTEQNSWFGKGLRKKKKNRKRK